MIRLPAYFSGFRSKSDGSAGLSFNTQELSADDFKELKNNHNAFGWLVFAPQGAEAEVPKEEVEEDGISASERLRRVMFVYWKQTINEGNFDLWRYPKYCLPVSEAPYILETTTLAALLGVSRKNHWS